MEIKQSKNNITLYKVILNAAVALLLLLIWLIFVAKNKQLDETIFNFLSFQVTNGRTNAMKVITFLGNHKFLIPVNLLVIILFLFWGEKQNALRVLIIALSSLGLMSLLKNIFQRHRPIKPLIEGITNFSFPSGHAFMSVVFFGMLIYFVDQKWKTNWWKLIIISLLLVIILLIGFSRIYLRVHYTTDVIAGWIFGSLWLMLCFTILDRILRQQKSVT